ncbi:MAG: PspA/IM30 family protein [Gammaproteobacteria bacterium]
MNNIKRLFVSIKSHIDHVADEFENHEALAGAAIDDLRETARKTRLHLHRVGKMSELYRKQLETQREQARLWSERAVKSKQEDEQKALQCVRRLRQAQRQIASLEQQCRESTAQEAKIRDDLNAIQEQLLVLENKKEILAARQNRIGIRDALPSSRGSTLQDAHGIFERWEGSVVSAEFDAPDHGADSDPLADEFEREEDELELKIMLEELANTKTSETNK